MRRAKRPGPANCSLNFTDGGTSDRHMEALERAEMRACAAAWPTRPTQPGSCMLASCCVAWVGSSCRSSEWLPSETGANFEAQQHPDTQPCLASGRGQSARASGWCVSQRLPRLRTRGAGNSPSIQFYSPPFVAGPRLTQPEYLASPPLEACFSARFRRHSATCFATREAFGILIGGRKPSKNLGPGKRAKFVGDSTCVAGPGPCPPRHSQFIAGCAAFGWIAAIGPSYGPDNPGKGVLRGIDSVSPASQLTLGSRDRHNLGKACQTAEG
ncbi:hypothetical protein L1887_42615 [Cichorium endivia]|nr:hypothetical protein L1887_42615 [Cichorium endivia]